MPNAAMPAFFAFINLLHYRGIVATVARSFEMEQRQTSINKKKTVARIKRAMRPGALERELLLRIEKAEGQLRGIKRMVSANAYCIDILQQISAVRGALQKLALILLRDHLGSCVSEAMLEKNADDKIRELIETLDRFVS
jgi:DNA-binding FrmR family transcriptional regulator